MVGWGINLLLKRGRGLLMQEYGVSVREILKRTVIVKARNAEDAIKKVEDAIERVELILDADDFYDREIRLYECWEDGKAPAGEDISYYWHLGEN